MPAQSGDPVTTALHRSLTSVKKCSKAVEEVDSMLVASAKQVLFADIKYEVAKNYGTTVLTDLKSKYIVLSPNCSNGAVKSEEVRISKEPQLVVKKVAKELVTLPVPTRVLYPPESVQLGWKGTVPIGSGFINMGNTCYLNSTLQALFHVPAFANWLINDNSHSAKCEQINGMTHSECLICAMSKTLQNSQRCTGSAIKPIQIYSKLKSICKHLVQGHQEDAHEFLRYLIEGMERSYLTIFNGLKLDTYSKETTPLNQIFGGYLRTEVTCLECQHVSTTFQHFQDILLDIRQVGSVDEALETYFGRERLGEGDQAYKCEQCHKRVAATKKFALERPPKALCIQLKRFGGMGGKNSKHINLKQSLDLSRFRYKASERPGQPLRYRLVAMVTHLGPSSNCGHYTAVGQSASGSYYLFDDSSVRALSLSSVLSTNAYIIMYEQESSSGATKIVVDSLAKPTNSQVTNGYTANGVEQRVSPSVEIKPVNNGLSPRPVEKIPLPAPPSATPTKSPERQPQVQAKSSETNGEKKEKRVESPSRLRLVPYVSESSESESEASSLTSPERINSPTTSPHRPSKQVSPTPCKSPVPGKSGVPTTSSQNEKPAAIKVEVDSAQQGWEVTPARVTAPSPTSSVGSSSGRWNVTSNDRTERQEKPSPNTSQPATNGEKTWDGNRHNSTVDQLLKMNHRGYGNNVNSWNGNRSEVEREADSERIQMKRSHSSYDDELDRGKIKKQKKYHPYKDERHNRFQEYQNRKNSWGNNTRRNFYHQYVFDRSRGHHYYRGNHRWH